MRSFSFVGFLGSFAFLGVATSLSATSSRAPSKTEPAAGQKLFLAKCAPCHGDKGQGGSRYKGTLTGSLSVDELGTFIHQAMPPGPKKCPAVQANLIAAYIYQAFYSPLAQERIRPARVELSRLTVRQFQNAVSDLVSGFHSAIPDSKTHGLSAEYFKGRSRDAGSRILKRIDPDVRFDFGTGAPAGTAADPSNFSISWSGSVLAPDTGEYEFSIHSKYSCSLWINGSRYPTVDGEVRSANDPDPTGVVTLLGGRSYSLSLVFTKATQGVDLNSKKPAPLTSSYITLMWRRPNHVEEPIPTQFLYPDWTPKTYVVTSPFPPDDRSTGYERGNSVSKEWDDATTAAALEAATYVAKNVAEVTGVPDNAPDRESKLKDRCREFVQRAFRRPLTDETKRTFIDKQFNVAPNLEMAVKRVVALTLMSPQFLYHEITPRVRDGYFVASQLSFGLWDTIPDAELENAAAKGKLTTPEQISAQANRMTGDNRAWSKLRQFLLLWLKVDEAADIVKNPKRFPTFDARTASDLRTSLELYLLNTAWSPASDYRDLMLSDKEYLNGRLAALYGLSLPSDAPFQEVTLDPGQRAGVMTQPYLLSRFAYVDGSDPIHRGVLLLRNLLGRTLNPPPSAFNPLPASLHPDLTTRQRVSLQTKPQFCANCHGRINPLGFTLERFDAIGRLRAVDNGKPVDCSGSYRASDGELVRFTGAQDLARYLADGPDSRTAFVTKLFLNFAKQPPMAYGPKTVDDLESSFVKDQYSIRKLLRDMAVRVALGAKLG